MQRHGREGVSEQLGRVFRKLTSVRLTLGILLIACVLSAGAPCAVRADVSEAAKQEAGEHFARGVELYEEGLFRAALVELKRAYEIAPHPRVLYNIGQTHAALGEFVQAIDALEGYLVQSGRTIDNERRNAVENLVSQLQSRVALLVIEVTGQPAKVLVDDQVVGDAPVELRVSVGSHRVEARADDGQSASESVLVAGGDRRKVTLEIAPPRPVADLSGANEERQPLSKRKRWAIGLFSGAVALGAAAGGVAAAASSSNKDLDKALDMQPGNQDDIDSARDKLSRRAVTTDALWISAAALGIGGAVMLLIGEPEETEEQPGPTVRFDVGPTGVMARGRF